MSNSDLTQIFQFFGSGLIIGGLFSTFSFIVGYFINFIMELTK